MNGTIHSDTRHIVTTARHNFPLTVLLILTGLAALLALVLLHRVSASDARILAIVLTCIVFWAGGSMSVLWVSLLFFFLAVTCTSLPRADIFSGFSSSAFWLVFSEAAIGSALKDSGLSARIGVVLARCAGRSYLKALFAFAVLSFLLSLLMPSTFGRIAILVPIASGYCDAVRLGPDANGRRGILLLVIVASYELASAILPASLPNAIMAGIVEQLRGTPLGFADYLLKFFPAGVVARGAVLIAASYWLFPDRITRTPAAEEIEPIGRRGWHTVILLSLTLAAWFTDSIHDIAPGWIGLGFTLLYFMTSPPAMLERFASSVNVDLLSFIAAIIGITTILQHLDMRPLAALNLEALRGSPLLAYGVLSALSVMLTFAFTANAAPAFYVPLVSHELARTAFLNAGLLAQVIGYGTVFLPYQAPPLLFGIRISGLEAHTARRYCLITGLAGLLCVMPVNALWWRILGML